MRRLLAIVCTVFALCTLIVAQNTPTTPLGPPTAFISATDLAGNPVSTNVYLTGGGALAQYAPRPQFLDLVFFPLMPGTDGDGLHPDNGSWEPVLLSTSRSCTDFPYPFPTDGSPCFDVRPFVPGSSGVVAPLSIVVAGQPMVFHDWEVVDPQPGACRTGNMGIRAIPTDPLYSGQAASAFVEGVEERLMAGSPTGTPPGDVKFAHFRAVYAPVSPDVTPPLVTVDTPRDCMQIPRGSAASVSFSCREDLGSGLQSCAATPGYQNGAAIDTSVVGSHSFTVTATDVAGNVRTRTIRYSIVDVTPPSAAPSVPAANMYGWHNTDVTVTWNWSDDAGGVGVDTAHCPASSTSIGEGAGIVVSGTCQDLAGNQKTASVTVNVDKTPPQADIRISPNPIVQGTTPQVLQNWTDGLSGMVAFGCGPLPTNAPGTFNLACSGSDKAGNSLPLQIPYTVALANGEYLFWHAGGLSSTINRINVDGTGRTSFQVLPNAGLISANGTSLYYNSDNDPMVSDGGAQRVDLNGGSPFQIVDPISGVHALAASTSYIYYRNEVVSFKAYPDGQTVGGTWFDAPFVLAADDTYVYTVIDSDIVRAGGDGSGQTTLATVAGGVGALARTGDWVYWVDASSGHIGRVKTDGSLPTSDLIVVNASAIAASSSYVFWANGGATTIGRANLDGTGVQMSFVTNDGGAIANMTAGGSPAFDSTAPSIQLTSPADGALYHLNQSVVADYTCSDGSGGAGLASCVGTVASGTGVDTSAYGTRTFTVTARDFSGNQRVATATYTVGYVFGGFASPIDAAPTVNSGSAGKTYPIKFQLFDNGGPVSDLGAVTSLTYLPTSCGAFAGNPTDALETDTSGNTALRYEPGSGSFIYNWKTPKAAGCYTVWLNLRSGQQFPVYFQLR